MRRQFQRSLRKPMRHLLAALQSPVVQITLVLLVTLYILFAFLLESEDYDGGVFSMSGPPSDPAKLWPYRQSRIRAALKSSWDAYRRDAFGCDEYHPVSKVGSNVTVSALGLTIASVVDNLLLMRLDAEYQQARSWIDKELDFNINGDVNVYAVTVHVLGGLLSAYHLSKDDMFLRKAMELGERLSYAFNTRIGFPAREMNLSKMTFTTSEIPLSTTEVTAVQLEFRYLGMLTGRRKYWDIAEKVTQALAKAETLDSMATVAILPNTGTFAVANAQVGSSADAYYETLFKQYLLGNGTQPQLLLQYRRATAGIEANLLLRSKPSNLVFFGTRLPTGALIPIVDASSCYIGGLLVLGACKGSSLGPQSTWSEPERIDYEIGKRVADTCWALHVSTPTGLAPEWTEFWDVEKMEPRSVLGLEAVTLATTLPDTAGTRLMKRAYMGQTSAKQKMPEMTAQQARYNILRPEMAETLFVLWRSTGDSMYRERGWKLFESIEKYCKIATGGYAGIPDVTAPGSNYLDKAETFFLSATLKYLYLMFGDADVLPLDQNVFTTEGHVFPISTPPASWV